MESLFINGIQALSLPLSSPLSPVLISFAAGGAALLLKVEKRKEGAGEEAGLYRRGTWVVLLLWIILTGLSLLLSALRFGAQGARTFYPGGWSEPLGIAFVMDGPALAMGLLIFLVSTAALLSACGKGEYGPGFFFFSWFMIAAGQAVSTGADLFTIFVFFEVLAVSAYILIGWKRKGRAIFAAFRYLVLASVSIACYLLGLYILYRHTGSLSIASIIAGAKELPPAQAALAAGGILTGLATRMALFPFHGWLPEAHSIAPHPVSALLSGVVIKIPLIPLLRIAPLFTGVVRLRIGEALLVTGILTALFGVILALQQRDAKRLLAYHSISQIGFIVAAFSLLFLEPDVGAGASTGAPAALFHAFNHGIFKSLLFLSVGGVCDRRGSRDVYTIRGAAGESPLLFIFFLAGAFSITGIPLFSGYMSKSLIADALLPYPVAWYLLLAVSAGTVASFIKLGRIFLPGKPADTGGQEPGGVEKPGPGWIGPGILALITFFTGTFTVLLFRWSRFLTGSGPFKAEKLAYIWKSGALMKQGAVTAAGVLLYLAIRTRPGRALAHTIRRIPGSTDTHIRSMYAGLLALWLFFFL